MSPALRRLATTSFALLVAAGAIGSTPRSAAAADLTISAGESEVVRLLNVERAKAGLVAVRVDSRLTSIARARSADMATKGYFSHVQPDGRSVFDFIAQRGITWYSAGEIIAWNTSATIADSATAARDGWMNSPGHRAIVMSSDFNYIGIGVAIEAGTSKKLWTGVFLKGPDRTGGYARVAAQTSTSTTSTSYRNATIRWSGADIRLVVLTSGFRHFQSQMRTDGGAWRTLSLATTSTSKSFRAWRGHTYDVRVRSCDNAGNCGTWAQATVTG
jgi:uncharacterized protein YkwD